MSSLETFLASYGLLAVVLGTFLEGETILVIAGLAAHRGYLSLPAVIAAGFFGSFIGDQLYFHIGRSRGQTLLARWPEWGARVTRAQRVLERHHVAFILGFRFIYGLRAVSPFAIGMSNVKLRRFVILNMLGGLVWSVAIALLGYVVGEGAEALLGRVKEIEVWLFLGVLIVGAIVWLVYFLKRGTKRAKPGSTKSADQSGDGNGDGDGLF